MRRGRYRRGKSRYRARSRKIRGWRAGRRF